MYLFSSFILGNIAFSASRHSNVGPTSQVTIITFDTVFTNIGNHCNSFSGMFVAPEEGLYQFYWAGTSASTSYDYSTVLFVNTSPVIGAQEISSSYPTMVDNMAILFLEAGSFVYVGLMANSLATSGNNGWNTYSTFSGRSLSGLYTLR